MARYPLTVATLSAALLAACAGSSSGADPAQVNPADAVVTAPADTSIQPGALLRFSAQVAGAAGGPVVWSVDEPDGGTIDSSGIYTAPAHEGTFHVRAERASATSSGVTVAGALRVTGDPSTFLKKKGGGTSVVRVSRTAAQTVAVTIAPTAATLDACGGRPFKASVTGTVDTSLTWTVSETGGGTVKDGAYVAPQTPGTYHVVAASVADPTRVALATVTVGPEKVLSLTVSPGTGVVLPEAAGVPDRVPRKGRRLRPAPRERRGRGVRAPRFRGREAPGGLR
jgi:hypothetical protein